MNLAPDHSVDHRAPPLILEVTRVGDRHLVQAVGAITAETRNELFCRCLTPGQLHVVLDMTHVSHFDGDGYAAVVSARRILESEGGSLELRNLASVPEPLPVDSGDHTGTAT